ncbi:MFS general substrate transporter [Laetiporus sulphureus 93-53]|uniref:MFS general substrate transporter n=1 Tax=Laetiporus sulphureus 93-53 TaxID=1314785 RepID=A0A165DX77_9APHY|nr:MFS general substrate transporter [Laetiporus sulphureus 93-53]KZT05812.1 MFS general substrate transporter [Laetiporus sulphureus 93-53]
MSAVEEFKLQQVTADSEPPKRDIHDVSTQQLLLQSPAPPPVEIPDGGLRAWMSILGGFIVLFCTLGYLNSFGVYQAYFTLAGTSSSSNISWIGSLQLFLTFFMGLPAGRLLDKGYFRITTIVGSLLFVFSMFMLSLTDPHDYYQIILSQGIGLGLGSGLLLVPAQSVQAHHWKRRRAFAIGIVSTGRSSHCAGVGGIVYPIMLNQLIHGSAGFAWGVRASAFLTLGLLAIANCLMTTRLPGRKDGLASMGMLKAFFADLAYIALMIGFFLTLWGLYYPYFYLQLWVNLHGLSENLAFYTIAILNAASIPGRVVLNILADDFGVFNVLCPVIFIMGMLVFAMFGVTHTGSVIVFAILYGFFSGSYFSLSPAALTSLAKNVDEVGVRLGAAYFMGSLAFLTGTPINGALLGSDDRWYRPTVFSGVSGPSCLAVLVLIVIRSCSSSGLCSPSSRDSCMHDARACTASNGARLHVLGCITQRSYCPLKYNNSC